MDKNVKSNLTEFLETLSHIKHKSSLCCFEWRSLLIANKRCSGKILAPRSVLTMCGKAYSFVLHVVGRKNIEYTVVRIWFQPCTPQKAWCVWLIQVWRNADSDWEIWVVFLQPFQSWKIPLSCSSELPQVLPTRFWELSIQHYHSTQAPQRHEFCLKLACLYRFCKTVLELCRSWDSLTCFFLHALDMDLECVSIQLLDVNEHMIAPLWCTWLYTNFFSHLVSHVWTHCVRVCT